MEKLENRIGDLTIMESLTDDGENCEKWGLPLRQLYRLGLSFYKEKNGKAIHLSYEDNLKLIAFTQQTNHGPLDVTTAPPLGVLDMIGRDRRDAWSNLGKISRAQSMVGFIELLDHLCPQFRPYVEAIKKDMEEKDRLAAEEERRQTELAVQERLRVEEQRKVDEQKNREEIQKRQLQDALNQQTYHQFKAYAEKQYPGNPEQQAILIRQLQTEHYHQYMQQVQAQTGTGSEKPDQPIDESGISGTTPPTISKESQPEDKEQCDSDTESGEFAVVSPANMWTRPDIAQFKQEVAAGKGDGVIKVGHGDTVTVRVPTHDGGSCLFWEFATDGYDIGFGVYFEWGKPTTTDVTVHISESDDDEDGLDEDEENQLAEDLESGPAGQVEPLSVRQRPLVSSIIPVYRRDCQNEVYAGSHTYPGEGVYLLKFDNHYSLWRSKTLYYRVFYTR